MSQRPVFLSHHSSLDHDTGAHPESVARMTAILDELKARDFCGYQQLSSPAAERAMLDAVHTAAHVEMIQRICASGIGQIDADTFVSRGSYSAALHAAGGAVELVRRLLEPKSVASETDGPAVGFSAHRPPGHHASVARAMGFCLFNNVAVAARYATNVLGLQRVMILDWDVHHGNGTSDIFWEDPKVLFCSIHQWPLYPGSGRTSEVGRGPGHGYTVNLPVPEGSGDRTYVSLVRDVAVPLARAYRPELILVSAGYDAHLNDPLGGCAVSDDGYAALTALVRDGARELNTPLAFVLEGGYDVQALARSVAVTMSTAAGAPLTGAAEQALAGPQDRLATEALARLSGFWPTLTPGQGEL